MKKRRGLADLLRSSAQLRLYADLRGSPLTNDEFEELVHEQPGDEALSLVERQSFRLEALELMLQPWVAHALGGGGKPATVRQAHAQVRKMLRRRSERPSGAFPEAIDVVQSFAAWRTELFQAFSVSSAALNEGLLKGNHRFRGFLEDPEMVHVHVRSPRSIPGQRSLPSESFRIDARQSRELWQVGNFAFPRFRYSPKELSHTNAKLLWMWGAPPTAVLLQTTTHVRGRVDNVSVFLLRRGSPDDRWFTHRMYLLDADDKSVAYQLGHESLSGKERGTGDISATLPAITCARRHRVQDTVDLVLCHQRLLTGANGFRRGQSRRLNTSERFARAIRGLPEHVDPATLVKWIDDCLTKSNPPSLAVVTPRG